LQEPSWVTTSSPNDLKQFVCSKQKTEINTTTHLDFESNFAIWSHEIDFQSHKFEPTSKALFEFMYIACQKWKQKLDATCQQ
jgi:hypothetical protein